MNIRCLLLSVLVLGFITGCFAEVIITDTIKVTSFRPTYHFTPGIYLTIKDWKNNQPIQKENIISEYDPHSPYFFLEVLSKDWLNYRDATGELRHIKCEAIFGYSVDNLIFTKDHTKISIIGAICHFTNVSYEIADPDFVDLPLLFMDSKLSSKTTSSVRKKEKLRQYLLDFETGAIATFNAANLEKLLTRDPELWAAYKQFKGNKKDKLYIFLRKYNERHPIYFGSKVI